MRASQPGIHHLVLGLLLLYLPFLILHQCFLTGGLLALWVGPSSLYRNS